MHLPLLWKTTMSCMPTWCAEQWGVPYHYYLLTCCTIHSEHQTLYMVSSTACNSQPPTCMSSENTFAVKKQCHVNQHAVLSRGSAPTMTGKDNSVMSTDITTCWPGETIHSEPQTLYTWSVVPQQWVGILLARKVVTANLKTQKPATTLKFVVKEPTPKFC